MPSIEESHFVDGGLILAVALGVVLFVISIWMRGRGKNEIRLSDLAIALLPFLVWLLASGQISKLGFAGVEIEVKDAILGAAREPVTDQVTTVDAVVDRIDAAERGPKGGEDLLPRLVEQRIEALEFRLGRGGYYVGTVIERYLDTLAPLPFFRFVLVLDEQGRLFGMFAAADLVDALDERNDGFEWFASALNRGGEQSGKELASLPGFISVDSAVTSMVDKRSALARMEEVGTSVLPVVDPDGKRFVGVLERDRVTASLILDITGKLERE